MKIFNVYEAKTNFSKLLELVQAGEEVVISKAGKPIADLKPHQPKKNVVKFGTMAGKLHYKDGDFVGVDPEIQEMFYGKDRNRQ